ncbi:MAG: ion transporter, partial [Halovenus sp.]
MVRPVIDRIAFLLRDQETHAGRTTNAVLYFLNGIFVLLYILSTYDFSQLLLSIIHGLELGLGFLFLGEYVIRVYSADSWVAEITNPYTIIDLLAVLPVFASPGFEAGFLRGFHTLRVFRFLRL